MLPPLPPAYSTLPGIAYRMGDWVTTTMKKRDHRGIVVALRKHDQSEPLALIVYEHPRPIPSKHKYISCEWVRVKALKDRSEGSMAEFLTHDNPMIREYFTLVQQNNGELVLEELWQRNERHKKQLWSTI